MKIIYLSGKLKGANWKETYHNIRIAKRAAVIIMNAGGGQYGVFCPHSHSENLGAFSETFWLRFDFELIPKCDGMIMLSGWKDSNGAYLEYVHAIQHNIPVFKSRKLKRMSYLEAKRLIACFDRVFNAD